MRRIAETRQAASMPAHAQRVDGQGEVLEERRVGGIERRHLAAALGQGLALPDQPLDRPAAGWVHRVDDVQDPHGFLRSASYSLASIRKRNQNVCSTKKISPALPSRKPSRST